MKKLERNEMKQLNGGVRTADDGGGGCWVHCANGNSYAVANATCDANGYTTSNGTYTKLC